MTIEEAIKSIKVCADQMNARYGGVVFDEWAVVSLLRQKAQILSYLGPRNDVFLQNFAKDLGGLRAGLLDRNFKTGDFEFARHGVGTGFEAFMVLAPGVYLICNNTQQSMDDITANPKWLNAQIHFAELGDQVRANPLKVAL
jgi:hypothetical protein